MKLLYPEFLWALLAILIPIIIHLFNFRKFKKEYFSNVELLKEVKLETQNKSKLKHWLVLAMRILAITMLVLAFCQPYFPKKETTKQFTDKVVAIYLDNSLSMDTKSDETYLIDKAKDIALSLIESYAPTDEYLLLTNDVESIHQRLVSQEEIKEFVLQTQVSPQSKTIEEIYQREKDLLSNFKGDKQVYWISDFQKNSFDFTSIQPDNSLNVHLLPMLNKSEANLYIDSVHFYNPLRQIENEEEINLRLVNLSGEDINVKTTLKINNETKGIVNTSLNANSKKEEKVNFSIHQRGNQFGELALEDYPNPNFILDDKFYFSYKVDQKTHILYLNNKQTDSTDAFVAVFSGDDNFDIEIKNLNTLDYSSLNHYSFIIINDLTSISSGLKEELKQYMLNGGNVLVAPSEQIDINSYQNFIGEITTATINTIQNTSLKIDHLNLQHPIYDNVFDEIPKNIDLPIALAYYPVHFATRSHTQFLMTLQNGEPFLSITDLEKGKLYLLSSPMNKNNFSQHALFVPTLLKIAELSTSNYPLYYTIGKDDFIIIPKNDYQQGKLVVKQNASDFEVIPELIKQNNGVSINLHNTIQQAGHYTLFYENSPILPLSFNYDRSESQFTYYNAEELHSAIENNDLSASFDIIESSFNPHTNQMEINLDDNKYWKLFILGALLFLLLEIVIIRVYK